MSRRKLTADAELENLQHESFSDFLHETNPDNGLVIDKTAVDWLASIVPPPASRWRLTRWQSSADLCPVPRR